jgi:hypothetical protein
MPVMLEKGFLRAGLSQAPYIISLFPNLSTYFSALQTYNMPRLLNCLCWCLRHILERVQTDDFKHVCHSYDLA